MREQAAWHFFWLSVAMLAVAAIAVACVWAFVWRKLQHLDDKASHFLALLRGEKKPPEDATIREMAEQLRITVAEVRLKGGAWITRPAAALALFFALLSALLFLLPGPGANIRHSDGMHATPSPSTSPNSRT